MAYLYFDALPPRTTKSTILRLLVQVGRLDRSSIGVVKIEGRSATAEVPERSLKRLAARLDGVTLADRHIRCWAEAVRRTGEEESLFQRFTRLLEMEAKAESQRTLEAMSTMSLKQAQRTGRSLHGLVIRDRTAGLGGRVLLTMGPRNPESQLPWTRLDAGSPVLLRSHDGGEGLRGVVSRRTPSEIEAAFERWPADDQDGPFRLDVASDEISRQRQRRALERAESLEGEPFATFRRVLLGQEKPSYQADLPKKIGLKATLGADRADTPADRQLNESQLEAVQFALSAEQLAIIHGPPGTGKTTTVVELIRQVVAGEEKVLACAPSNMAVDNLLERLIAIGVNAIRLGHPARVLPQVRERTLDLMVQSHPDLQIVKKLMQKARALYDKADRYTRARPAPGSKRQMRDEAKQMIGDAKRLEGQVVRSILDGCDVLCATNTSLDSQLLGQRRFDLAIIDEACQSVEPGCWIPILRADRLVLAGDHCQLPPTVISRDAVKEGFDVSMLERLVSQFGTTSTRRLTVQYRMHDQIMSFSSDQFYDGALSGDDSVRRHELCDLEDVQRDEWTNGALHFIDTAGSGADEEEEEDGASRRNLREAELVEIIANSLIAAGLPASDIAVIAPYSAQVRLLRERMQSHESLEIDSVDGFQGREKEAVIVSLVRSNSESQIGFLSDTRRMNVAWTRAKRKLFVIGDSATIGGHPFYAAMLEHFERADAYHTIWEYDY
jgi:DNA polymerase III delta prime subunit